MVEIKQVLIPDIGDFKDVPVIEVLVKTGDQVKSEDALISLESDKATIESIALADEKTQQYTNGKVISKVIVVPNRLVNIVVGEK